MSHGFGTSGSDASGNGSIADGGFKRVRLLIESHGTELQKTIGAPSSSGNARTDSRPCKESRRRARAEDRDPAGGPALRV